MSSPTTIPDVFACIIVDICIDLYLGYNGPSRAGEKRKGARRDPVQESAAPRFSTPQANLTVRVAGPGFVLHVIRLA